MCDHDFAPTREFSKVCLLCGLVGDAGPNFQTFQRPTHLGMSGDQLNVFSTNDSWLLETLTKLNLPDALLSDVQRTIKKLGECLPKNVRTRKEDLKAASIFLCSRKRNLDRFLLDIAYYSESTPRRIQKIIKLTFTPAPSNIKCTGALFELMCFFCHLNQYDIRLLKAEITRESERDELSGFPAKTLISTIIYKYLRTTSNKLCLKQVSDLTGVSVTSMCRLLRKIGQTP